MTTKNISLYEREFDLVVESVLCKMEQNRKAIEMIYNPDAKIALEREQKELRSLLDYLTEKENKQ